MKGSARALPAGGTPAIRASLPAGSSDVREPEPHSGDAWIAGVSPARSVPSRSAFSLVEVLACLLVLTLGFAAAIALVAYGLQLARTGLAKSIGMSTAISVTVDPTPLLPSGQTLTTASGVTKGWMNGLWVERKEEDAEVINTRLTSTLVRVEVYESGNGRLICSYQERLLKQTP